LGGRIEELRKYCTTPKKPETNWKGLIGRYVKTFARETKQTSKAGDQATKEAKKTSETKSEDKKEPKWIFRGQRKGWPLQTSLERTFAQYGFRNGDDAIENERRNTEKAMLRSFMRKAHHYLPHVPNADDLIEWLALMRHYGAPTRMLDWTYSFYVAVYNAVEGWNPKEQDAKDNTSRKEAERETANRQAKEKKYDKRWPVIWALDAVWLKPDPILSFLERLTPEGIDKTRHEDNSFVRDFMESPTARPLVYNATGFRLNERLIAQQGTFLIQGSLARSFEENLKESLEKPKTARRDHPKKHFYRIYLKINGDERDRILRELNNMNINHATLYPGLEGFAQSLERHLAYPENWGLDIKKEY
jgi:hypothetical protein